MGIQGCLPSKFATALMIGQTVAGLIAVFASIISVISMQNNSDKEQALSQQATAYFASAIGAIALCALAFWMFLKLPVVFYYLGVSQSVQVREIMLNKKYYTSSRTRQKVSRNMF